MPPTPRTRSIEVPKRDFYGTDFDATCRDAGDRCLYHFIVMLATRSKPAAIPAVAPSHADRDHGRPFQWALGESIGALAPKVREHILQPPGTVVVYLGTMRVWRDRGWRGRLSGWLLRIGTLASFMFPETGDDVGFKIEHAVASDDNGCLSMTWIRTFHFAQGRSRRTRRFDAVMRFHPNFGPIVNWHGCRGCLQVELCPRVEGDAIVVDSRREWLRLGPLRIPIPDWLKGRPYVREWQEPDGALHIRVEIHNALLGQFFGYEGRYTRMSTT